MLEIFQFSTHIFSADITPEMLKLCKVTKVKVFFPVLVYVFNFDLFEISAAILEKALLQEDECGLSFRAANGTKSYNYYPMPIKVAHAFYRVKYIID